MSYLFTREYDLELMSMNKDMYQVFIESNLSHGGERRVVLLRQNEKGLPLTLVNNYTDSGSFNVDTESRDIRKIESELQVISRTSQSGAIVCVPIRPLTKELMNIEKLSPKLASYAAKRLLSIGIVF
mgnify:FL=1|tara:strand:- start:566 stop:946 length:381 start_codon:yes stop_codon:yes gene_type:complete